MKKDIYSAVFSSIITSCAPRYAPPPDLPQSITMISDPVEAQQWLETVLTYREDLQLHGQQDFWAPCSLTYALRGGDCEDYAICAAALLSGDVEKGYIVYVDDRDKSKDKIAHAVFAYQYHGRWGINSNNTSEFRRPLFANVHQAIVDSLGHKYTHYQLLDYSSANIFAGNQNLGSKMRLVEEHKMK